MNNDEHSGDPFDDFINETLDMHGVNGFDHLEVADQVRRLLPVLSESVTPELWDDQLNDLQSVIRVCLDLETVLGAFRQTPESEKFSRDDLESLIMVSVTFAFISYNQLLPAYNKEELYSTDNNVLACRLRATLQAAMGWVRRAAHDGDPVATRFTEEVVALLDSSAHLKP